MLCVLCEFVLYSVCPVYVVSHKSDNKPGAAALSLTRPPNVGFDQATSTKRDGGKAQILKTSLHTVFGGAVFNQRAHLCGM